MRALDDVLASSEVERSLIDLRVVDGTFDARPFLAVVSDKLSDRAEQSAVLVAVRARRGQRESSTITS